MILTPKEVFATEMALSAMIEDLEAMVNNQQYPFTPEARAEMKDILATSRSAHKKIALASGNLVKLDPYKEGDEKEFLTKES